MKSMSGKELAKLLEANGWDLLSLLEGKSAKTNIDAEPAITDDPIENSIESSKIERDEIEE
jgi:hypothetical protein